MVKNYNTFEVLNNEYSQLLWTNHLSYVFNYSRFLCSKIAFIYHFVAYSKRSCLLCSYLVTLKSRLTYQTVALQTATIAEPFFLS